MTTTRCLEILGVALAGTLLHPAAPAAAQTPDWTLDVPVRVSSLDPAVRHVVVSCLVGPDTVDEPALGNHFVGTPGSVIEAWDGVNMPPFAAGVVAVRPDAGGSVQTQVSVPIHAPPAMTVAQKLAATTWTCGLALSTHPNDPMARVLAGFNPFDEYPFAVPAEGAPFTAVVSGTFN